MSDIAAGVRELSSILRELRKILKNGTRMFSSSLFRSIHSATKRIRALHDEIHELVSSRDSFQDLVGVSEGQS